MNFDAIQSALDSMEGVTASFGYNYSYEGKKFYTCSLLTFGRAHRYGSGPTIEAAYEAAQKAALVIPKVAA